MENYLTLVCLGIFLIIIHSSASGILNHCKLNENSAVNSTMNLNIGGLSRFIWKSQAVPGFGFQQVRNKWANWLMIRDVKRRRMSAEHFLERTRINAMRRNNVLPLEIRELADKEINKFEMNAIPLRINNRCVITSRPRGIVKEWRMSRIVWRHLADYNKLSGVQRAMWG